MSIARNLRNSIPSYQASIGPSAPTKKAASDYDAALKY
jgi:hypothetical protein